MVALYVLIVANPIQQFALFWRAQAEFSPGTIGGQTDCIS